MWKAINLEPRPTPYVKINFLMKPSTPGHIRNINMLTYLPKI